MHSLANSSVCHEILRQTPVQADSVEHLRKLLNVASGGVVFTTIQNFMPEERGGKAPELSKRRNIIVIADEAHRSQYDLIDGLARPFRVPRFAFHVLKFFFSTTFLCGLKKMATHGPLLKEQLQRQSRLRSETLAPAIVSIFELKDRYYSAFDFSYRRDRRRQRKYIVGIMRRVRMVELTMPPTIGAAMRFIVSAPVP
jgi:hypothetical protein